MSIPVWLLMLLIACTAILLIQWSRHLFGNKQQLSYHHYNEDVIHGIVWRWDWQGEDAVDLCPYCPQCDCGLSYSEPNFMDRSQDTSFFCDHCSSVISRIKGGGFAYAKGVVRREIDRKVRNQLYPTHEAE